LPIGPKEEKLEDPIINTFKEELELPRKELSRINQGGSKVITFLIGRNPGKGPRDH